jgi:plasmid stabilization system protein ParE
MVTDMEEYSVIWTEDAYESLHKIQDFIAIHSSKKSKSIVKDLVKLSISLKTLPNRYAKESIQSEIIADFRAIIKKPYKLIYTVVEAEKMVLILLVFDTRQDHNKLKIRN